MLKTQQVRLSKTIIVFIFFFIMHTRPGFSQDTLNSRIKAAWQDTVTGNLKTGPLVGTLDLFITAPRVTGGVRDEFEVAQKIMNKKNFFIQCYTNNITKFDNLTFRIRFEIVVKPSGEVESVNVLTRGTKNQTMINCFRSVFRQIRFSAVDSGQNMVIEQSLIFRII